jgi:hypothetical protein
MNIVSGAVRVVTRAADATTAVAGAVGGAAINGVVGGIQGTAAGLRAGLNNGSESSAAAALTLAAVGAAGLVEWPVLLAVGGSALVVHRLSQRSSEDHTGAQQPARAAVAPRPSGTTRRAASSTTRPGKAKPSKASKAAKRTPAKPRRTTAK